MPIIDTHIPGLFVFEPKVFEDERGYFMRVIMQIFLQKKISI